MPTATTTTNISAASSTTIAMTKLRYASRTTTTTTSYSSVHLSSRSPSGPSHHFEHYPQALMLFQYFAAATQAAAFYMFSAIWSLAQSIAWIVTVEGLNWIQTFGPMILEWDVFLVGAVFLMMDVDFDSFDQDMYPTLSRNGTRHGSRASSLSSSSSKKVSFDEQVKVIAGSAQRNVAAISITTDFSGSRIDPSVPLTESPTRTVFSYGSQEGLKADSPALLSMMQQEEAEYRFYSSESKSGSPRFVESPLSSPSSSCRSSICSVSSDSSDKESKKSRSASSRLTSFFQSSALHQQGEPAEKRNRGGKNIVRKIMHPHRYKRELEVHQQQLSYNFEQHVAVPESVCLRASSDCEYQPDAHHRKSFIRRLGLKKKSTL
ncbi:hypothetical protein EDD21DRAFT_368004 [Dissophora ornata]|nr:hypothetical protein EDD21DRAFT_368004 [Dissophora ornata]